MFWSCSAAGVYSFIFWLCSSFCLHLDGNDHLVFDAFMDGQGLLESSDLRKNPVDAAGVASYVPSGRGSAHVDLPPDRPITHALPARNIARSV